MRHDMHRTVAHCRSCDCHGVRPQNLLVFCQARLTFSFPLIRFWMERRGRIAGLGHFTFAVVELTFLLFIVLQVWHEVFHLARMLCSDTPLPFSQSRLTSISEQEMRQNYFNQGLCSGMRGLRTKFCTSGWCLYCCPSSFYICQG